MAASATGADNGDRAHAAENAPAQMTMVSAPRHRNIANDVISCHAADQSTDPIVGQRRSKAPAGLNQLRVDLIVDVHNVTTCRRKKGETRP